MAASQSVIERATLTLPLLEEKLATHTGLYNKSYGARPPVLQAQQELVEKRAELKSARESVRQAEAEMRSIRAKIATAQAAYLADANDRRTKALQKFAQLTQSITKARQRESYRRLVAPVSGTVQGLKIHTPGAVVTTADVLMTVVPDGTRIEVDAQVLNKDVGFVSEGQAAEIKFEAFQFTRYGLIGGSVRKLGRDAVPAGPSAQAQGQGQGAAAAPGAPSAAGSGQPTGEFAYPARVTIYRDWIETENGREALRSGMRVSVEIVAA
jgi:hemolysin D